MTKRASAMSHSSSKTEVLVSKRIILKVGIVILAVFYLSYLTCDCMSFSLLKVFCDCDKV
jgi:uncharacterized membrane protein YczE